jgi:hypothetical protein
MTAGYDFYVPWRNVESALIATNEPHVENFESDAGNW